MMFATQITEASTVTIGLAVTIAAALTSGITAFTMIRAKVVALESQVAKLVGEVAANTVWRHRQDGINAGVAQSIQRRDTEPHDLPRS